MRTACIFLFSIALIGGVRAVRADCPCEVEVSGPGSLTIDNEWDSFTIENCCASQPGQPLNKQMQIDITYPFGEYDENTCACVLITVTKKLVVGGVAPGCTKRTWDVKYRVYITWSKKYRCQQNGIEGVCYDNITFIPLGPDQYITREDLDEECVLV